MADPDPGRERKTGDMFNKICGCWLVHFLVAALLGFASPLSSGVPSSLDDPVDKTGWVNPHDMGVRPLSPSQVLEKARQQQLNDEEEEHGGGGGDDPSLPSMQVRLAEIAKCGDMERELEWCRKRVQLLEHDLDQGDNQPNSTTEKCICADQRENEAFFFLKRYPFGLQIFACLVLCSCRVKIKHSHFRYTHFLVRHFGLHGEDGDSHQFRTEVQFSPSEVAILASFASSKTNTQQRLSDVDSILTGMFKRTHQFSEDKEELSLMQSLALQMPGPEELLRAILVGATVIALLMLWQGALSIWKVLSMLLILSSAWHWTHLYKRALSKKHTVLVKEKGIPAACFPDELSWSYFFYHKVFSHRDRCNDYHDALLVDPLWEVSPTMAVAETIVQFIVLPLEHLGKHLGRFFSSLLGELSWLSSTPVLLFVFVAITLILIMAFGYRFKFPLCLGSFEPHRHSASRIIDDLRSELNCLRDQRVLEMQREASPSKQLEETQELPERTPSAPEDKQMQSAVSKRDQTTGAEGDILDRALCIEKEWPKCSCTVIKPLSVKEEDPDPLLGKSAPEKNLIVRGSLSNPRDTDFEWVEEEEEEKEYKSGTVVPDQDSTTCGDEDKNKSSCLPPNQPHQHKVQDGFLNKIESVFEAN